MRMKARLVSVLLLLSFLYTLFSTNDEVTTFSSTYPDSITGMNDDFSITVPTRPEINSILEVKVKIKPRRYIKRARSNSKVQKDSKDRQKSQKKVKRRQFKNRTSEKQGRVKTRANSSAEEIPGSGYNMENNSSISKIYKLHSHHRNTKPSNRSFLVVKNPSNAPRISKLPDREFKGRTSKTYTSSKDKIKTERMESLHHVRSTRVLPKRRTTVQTEQGSQNSSGVRVIIVAHGRSGSSFFGGIFNAHPDFFFMYEPLNQLKRIVEINPDDYLYYAEDLVKSILNCNFKDDKFLEIISQHSHHRASCRPLVSPPFCNTTYERAINFIENTKWTLCNETIPAVVANNICRKHKNIASKILLNSIEPAELSWILLISGSNPRFARFPRDLRTERPTESRTQNTHNPVHVLYLVRDPRAMIFSRYKLGWVVPQVRKEHGLVSGEADQMVEKVCETIEKNLGAVVLNPQHIKLIRYEELATNPESIVKRLFSELRISPSEIVFRWIYNKTHGPTNLNALGLSRNANDSINAWRKFMSDELLKIVERRCEQVMKYLGYVPTNGSQKVRRDMRKPLWLGKIKDLKESYEWPVMNMDEL